MPRSPTTPRNSSPAAAAADYFIHGRGRGHASRFGAVQQGLNRSGLAVRVHSGGAALDMLNDAEATILARSPLRRGPLSPLWLAARSLKDAAHFIRHRPWLVVSDGDHAAILGARAAGIAVLAVGHDLVFNGEVLLPNLPRAALLAQRINALPTRAATRGIAVHFLPTTSRDPRIRVARPESTASGEALEDRAAPVVCYFRDQNGLEIARRLARAGRDVLLFGDTAQDEPKIRVQPFCKDGFRRALLGSSAVVASAGSNLLAECVALHKPVLAVYRRYDSEQMLNALLAQHAEVGVACELGKASDTVMRFISRVERGDFARVDLENELPPLSQVVGATLSELQGSGKGSPAPALDEPGAVKASPTTGH